MTKKATNKKVNEKLTNNSNFIVPETNEEFRELIKKVTHEELKKFLQRRTTDYV
jgi:hypothetical protein